MIAINGKVTVTFYEVDGDYYQTFKAAVAEHEFEFDLHFNW